MCRPEMSDAEAANAICAAIRAGRVRVVGAPLSPWRAAIDLRADGDRRAARPAAPPRPPSRLVSRPAFLVACPDADTILPGRRCCCRRLSRHDPVTRRRRRAGRRAAAKPAPASATLAPSPQAEAYLDAVRKGDVAAVEKALAAGVAVDTPFRYNRTALSFAADRGHVEVVRLLLAKGANPDATDSFYNQSALGWASSPAQTRRPEHAEVVKLLLEKGAKGRERALGAAIGERRRPHGCR